MYSYKNSNTIVDLKEGDNNNEKNVKEKINNKKLNQIEEESKKVDYLIKIIDDKLSEQNEKENKFNNISLLQSDLIPLIQDEKNSSNLMVIKSESGIKVEDLLKNEPINKEQKKIEIYMGKLNEENVDLSSYSNKSCIISNNNTSLSIINIDLNKENQEEKDNTPINNNIKNENKLEEDRINNFFNTYRNDLIINDSSSDDDNICNFFL